MNEPEYLNMVMDRFDEAVKFHNLLGVIKLRFHNHPAAPILLQLVESLRDDALGLGIQEYGIFRKQEFAVTSRTISDSALETGNGSIRSIEDPT